MMRKERCTKCGTKFFTADPDATECQNCGNNRPNRKTQTKKEAEAKIAANRAPKSKTKQTVDLKKIQGTDDATTG